MKVKKYARDILAAAFGFLVLTTPSLAATTIRADYGGSLVKYIDKYTAIKETEGKLRLDGFCLSACTMFLGIVPRKDTCATPGSLLGFHSASTLNGEYAPEGTRLLWNLYPENVRELLRGRGWNGETEAHPEFIYVPANELMETCSGT